MTRIFSPQSKVKIYSMYYCGVCHMRHSFLRSVVLESDIHFDSLKDCFYLVSQIHLNLLWCPSDQMPPRVQNEQIKLSGLAKLTFDWLVVNPI
jgi:hypothetical protein